MLHLTTGANGAGKTLFTLLEVQARSLKESRPVCYNGRFELVPDGPLANWKRIDLKDWQAEPDGTIFFVDECHNDLPVRGTKDPVPEYVRMLAEHRKRGFDFYLITQHPQNIDVFVRRLIGSPGWHRHLKRTFGASLVSQLEWAAVNGQCERPGSGESGVVAMRKFPTEVYSWYRSAELHTGKTRIPKVVYFLAAAAVIVPTLAYFAAKIIMKPNDIAAKVLGDKAAAAAAAGGPGGAVTTVVPSRVQTAAEFLSARVPRVEGFAYTAPAYDQVTQPTVAPYPAACIVGFNRRLNKPGCTCYTQQGTLLPVPESSCRQIAENGFFLDWAQARQEAPQRAQATAPGGKVVAAAVVAPAASASVAPVAQVEPVSALVGSEDGSAIAALRSGQRRW